MAKKKKSLGDGGPAAPAGFVPISGGAVPLYDALPMLGVEGPPGIPVQPELMAGPASSLERASKTNALISVVSLEGNELVFVEDKPHLPKVGKKGDKQAAVEPVQKVEVALSRQAEDYIPIGNPFASPIGEAGPGPGAVAEKEEEEAAEGGTKARERTSIPWLRNKTGKIRAPLLRLHQEIVDFCAYVRPTPEETASRHKAVQEVREVVASIWPNSRTVVFGSFATGMFLPTSDLDVVVLDSGCSDVAHQGLRALANALTRRGLAKEMQVISKARVPIIKFEHSSSGFQFDVSFDVANGPQAADFVRTQMDAMPALMPLMMVLKLFLQQRELNEVYTGGIGSYALLTMLIVHLQMHPSRTRGRTGKGRAAAPLEQSLGVLLLDFLKLYGSQLNMTEVGISARHGGRFISKEKLGMVERNRPFLLAIVDPQQEDNDIGRNSYNINKVRMAFDFATQALSAPCPSGSGGSVLERVVRLDEKLLGRTRLGEGATVGGLDQGGQDGEGGGAAQKKAPKRPPGLPPPPPGLGSGGGKKGKKRAREDVEDEGEEEGEAGGRGGRRKGGGGGRKQKKKRGGEEGKRDKGGSKGGGSGLQITAGAGGRKVRR